MTLNILTFNMFYIHTSCDSEIPLNCNKLSIFVSKIIFVPFTWVISKHILLNSGLYSTNTNKKYTPCPQNVQIFSKYSQLCTITIKRHEYLSIFNNIFNSSENQYDRY